MFEHNLHVCRALILKVIDGDTITTSTDLGRGIWIRETLRLYGINAPETRGGERVEGLESKEWLEDFLIRECKRSVIIKTFKLKSGWQKRGKYGRLLAKVYDQEGHCVNDMLVSQGLAEYVTYLPEDLT